MRVPHACLSVCMNFMHVARTDAEGLEPREFRNLTSETIEAKPRVVPRLLHFKGAATTVA